MASFARALRLVRWLALGLVAFSLLCTASGCGPIEYITYVSAEAASAVAAARVAGAERYAPYEYTAAVENLHKARELGGYARYEEAATFGKKARDFGRAAFALASRKAGQPDEVRGE